LDALLFTGSYATGVQLRKALVDQPATLLALEMGGNNPLVVHDVDDIDAAALLCVLSAYITSGQRCTCARRLILVDGPQAERLMARLTEILAGVRVGAYTDEPEPFMGPLVSADAAQHVLQAQKRLISRGARPLAAAAAYENDGGCSMLRPGLLDVTAVKDRADQEIFGPLLQLIRVSDFDAAIVEADRTAYGLAAALFSKNHDLYERFSNSVRAGVINWNRPTTGASGALPFGGTGNSGNHRPSGYFAADYCSYPTASLESPTLEPPADLPPGISP
jgi:succinylglutamic semialdehyde dehydrogenase